MPGGDKYKDRSVLSFHYYCWWYGAGNFTRETCDAGFASKVYEQVYKDIGRTGVCTPYHILP